MSESKDMKIISGCLAVLTVIAVGIVLKEARNVFLPFFIAWLLSYFLSPGIKFMAKLKVPVWFTTFVMIALLLVGAEQAGSLLISLLKGSSDKLGAYLSQFMDILQALMGRFGYDDTIVGLTKEEVLPRMVETLKTLGGSASAASSASAKVMGFLTGMMSTTVMTIVFLLFILMGTPYLEYKVLNAFPKKYNMVLMISETIAHQVGRFLSVMTLISAATGVCIWFGLSQIGVDFAGTWGVLAFVLNFIPTVGSIIASIPPIIISIVQFHGVSAGFVPWLPNEVIATVLLILSVQVTIGNIITPKVMGDSLDLSPTVILMSLMLWSFLWGIPGAFFSMPIAGMIKIVCDNVDRLHMVAVLMSSGESCKKSALAQQVEKER